jgi:5-methylcytosine-specific restriction endonuclease McrA
MQYKKCTRCHNDLPLTDYHKDRKGKWGLRSWCKKCESKRCKHSTIADKRKAHRENKTVVYYNGRAGKLKQRAPGNVTGEDLMELMSVCGHKCVYCGSEESLQFDHVISVESGGTSDLCNISVLCADCNRMKGRRNHRDFIALLVKIISNLGTDNTEPSPRNGEGVTTIP